jgi:hypothetical protein
MTALANLYNQAMFDADNMRWLVPRNLRKFTMWIYVTEIRNFFKTTRLTGSSAAVSALDDLSSLVSSNRNPGGSLANTPPGERQPAGAGNAFNSFTGLSIFIPGALTYNSATSFPAKLPVLDLGYSAISLQQGASITVTPQTLNYLGNTQTFETSGYSATISDIRLMSTFNGVGINTTAAQSANTSTTTLGTDVSSTVIGSQINLRATTVNTLFGTNSQLSATLTIIGLDSGARLTIPITINKTNV